MDKLLITGAGGFIGSHLVEECVKAGFNVKCFVRYNSNNSLGWLENNPIKDDIEIVRGDIRDYDSVYNALQDCNSVFHLAALISIPYSYVSPLAYIKTNINGTYNILQASKELNLNKVIITSTSETYGTAQYVPIDEKHPLVGQSPYSASKIGADQLAISYHRSFELPVSIVRPFNTYGPRQSARAIIPTVISQIVAGKKEIKLGNINPTRDLTFVSDTARGFISIYQSEQLNGEVTNIGMNNEIKIGELVKLIASLMNIDIKIVTDTKRIRPAQSEVERLYCDNSKIITHTKWQPEFNLKSGLLKTIAWIKENSNQFNSDIYNI